MRDAYVYCGLIEQEKFIWEVVKTEQLQKSGTF